jgi:NAD(P)-dependent dehydrogenase (short-subunit alcohol dehydrogenase family)
MKTAVVTGASSGIGKAICLELLKEGFRVIGMARRTAEMQDIVQAGGQAWSLDMTDSASIEEAVRKAGEEAGTVDVLVNCAGYGLYGPVETVSLEEARRQFEVNLFGLARLTQLLIPGMRERRAGRIVNISSMGGRIYTPFGAWYHASKHALEGWSDCLRIELAPFGIDVIIIEPGAIQTSFGGVVEEALMKSAGGTEYEPAVKRLIGALSRGSQEGAFSPPSLIAETVALAVRAKRPKTRYARGRYAKLLLAMRKALPDHVFDLAVQRLSG